VPGQRRKRREAEKEAHYTGQPLGHENLSPSGLDGEPYLASQCRRLARHRGRKRALIAVGHSMLVIFYHENRIELRRLERRLFRQFGT
jgi:hypothetical protein